MSFDLNLIKEIVNQNNSVSLNALNNDDLFDYIKTTLQKLNKNTDLISLCCRSRSRNQTECLPTSNYSLINISFIRISTRNADFVEKYFIADVEGLNLFELFLIHYQNLIAHGALKNNYLCEMAKIISNTIIQTKKLAKSNNFNLIMSQLKPIFENVINWLEKDCVFDKFTSDCMYHHLRWIFLVCSYNEWARDVLVEHFDCVLILYDRLYDALTEYSADGKELEFFSKILVLATNSLFNVTHSLSNKFKGPERLSTIYYKYLCLMSSVYESNRENNNLQTYENLVCHLMSCLSCNGGIFEIFKLRSKDPLVSKVQTSTPTFLRKIQYTGSFANTFEKYNVSRIVFLMEILQNLVVSVLNYKKCAKSSEHPCEFGGDKSGDLIKFIVGMISLCKYDKIFRRYIRFQIIPPLKESNVKIRPEQEESLRGYFSRLLTTSDFNLNMIVGEFLFVLCRENVERLVKYFGMGNIMGYLHYRGLLAPNDENDTNSSSDYSDIEDYDQIVEKIDPITGSISKHSEINSIKNSCLNKEREMNSLMENIEKLQKLDIITTANISDKGKIVQSNFVKNKK